MRTLLALIVLILIVLGIAPFVTGYQFKKIYLDQIAMYQQHVQGKGMEIEVVDYHLGWLQSNSKLKVTFTDTSSNKYNMPPMVMMVNSTINHGPIIHNPETGEFSLAYAVVHTNVHLPDMIKAFVPDTGNGFMQITASVPFDTKVWHNHFVIQPINLLGKVSWDGLKGDAIVTYDQNKLTNIQAVFTFGAVMVAADPAYPEMPQVHVSPLKYTVNSKKVSKDIFSGSTSLTTEGFVATWKNGQTLSANQYNMASNYGLTAANLYQLSEQSTLKTIQLPSNLPVTLISNVKEGFNVNDLNPEGLHNLTHFMRTYKDDKNTPPDPNVIFAKVMQVFTPTSNIGWTISLNTNLGASTTNVKVYWQALPTNINELPDNINVNFNARFAASLVENVITRYFINKNKESNPDVAPQATPVESDVYKNTVADLLKAQQISLPDSLTLLGFQDQKLSATEFTEKLKTLPNLSPELATQLESSYNQQLAAQPPTLEPVTPKTDPVQEAQQMIGQLIQAGYLAKDNNDYVINLTKTGKQVILNGKDVSDQYQQMLEKGVEAKGSATVGAEP